MQRNIWPVATQDHLAMRVALALKYYLPASAFEAEVEAADACEKRCEFHCYALFRAETRFSASACRVAGQSSHSQTMKTRQPAARSWC